MTTPPDDPEIGEKAIRHVTRSTSGSRSNARHRRSRRISGRPAHGVGRGRGRYSQAGRSGTTPVLDVRDVLVGRPTR